MNFNLFNTFILETNINLLFKKSYIVSSFGYLINANMLFMCVDNLETIWNSIEKFKEKLWIKDDLKYLLHILLI